MSEQAVRRGNRGWTVIYGVWCVALVAELVLLFLLSSGPIEWLGWAGWGLFAISALLGWVPIFVFRRHGRVARGSAYIQTTRLVTSGLYAIVRHPQYLAGDFIAAAVMCITQHWATIALGVVVVVTNRLSMRKADRDLVEKFGEPYREYMERVPRASLALGLYRWCRRRREARA